MLVGLVEGATVVNQAQVNWFQTGDQFDERRKKKGYSESGQLSKVNPRSYLTDCTFNNVLRAAGTYSGRGNSGNKTKWP